MSDVLATVGLGFAQVVLVVALAPLFNGLVKTAKARLQGREGPPVLQPYLDLWKLLRKDIVASEHSSLVFRAAPAVYAASCLAAALLVPVLWLPAPLATWGDAILLVGLLALGRFALAIAALDTGSSFGGMGASREVAIAALVEPALLLGIFAVALPGGGTDVSALAARLLADPSSAIAPSQLLAFVALSVVLVAETGRVPVDNPDTHLELTMIHEGMLLEHSGRALGILHWATLVKQLALVALLIALFAPIGIALSAAALPIAALALSVKLTVAAGALALVESSGAKLRILRVPELLGAATALAALAVAAAVVVP